MKERATIDDVARMAGVAKSTVSRFLNGKPVREESARRIRQAIDHYGYEANVFARLSAKQSHIIGIILPGFDSTTTPRVLTAMDKYLRTKSYTPLFINTEGDLSYEVHSIGSLARMNVDGIIIVASPQELVGMIVEKAANMARMMNIPILGLVENMSYVECPDCGKKIYVFGESHIDEIAAQYQVPVLAKIPVDPELAAACDAGKIEFTERDYMKDAVELLKKL